jgi:hypothetical protein
MNYFKPRARSVEFEDSLLLGDCNTGGAPETFRSVQDFAHMVQNGICQWHSGHMNHVNLANVLRNKIVLLSWIIGTPHTGIRSDDTSSATITGIVTHL